MVYDIGPVMSPFFSKQLASYQAETDRIAAEAGPQSAALGAAGNIGAAAQRRKGLGAQAKMQAGAQRDVAHKQGQVQRDVAYEQGQVQRDVAGMRGQAQRDVAEISAQSALNVRSVGRVARDSLGGLLDGILGDSADSDFSRPDKERQTGDFSSFMKMDQTKQSAFVAKLKKDDPDKFLEFAKQYRSSL